MRRCLGSTSLRLFNWAVAGELELQGRKAEGGMGTERKVYGYGGVGTSKRRRGVSRELADKGGD